tara:strand:- start:39 stop:467 length:429 start_codon:yes stop_codon:yes gene_type:complete
MAGITDYQREQRALQDAFVHKMLLDYDIREVTTQRQAKNGTREFKFPVSCFSKRMRTWNGVDRLPKDRLRMAIFKNGYVRKQNGAYCPYPINRRYTRLHKYTYVFEGNLQSRQYMTKAYELHLGPMTSLNYMLQYYLRNYAK